LKLPVYPVGGKEATRKAYGDALTALGAHRPEVVALDGEVSNSTHADEFKKAFPDRVEDHWIEGGLGDAVLEAFTGVGTKPPTVLKLGVRKMPGSTTPAQLMSAAGIDAEHVVQAVRALLWSSRLAGLAGPGGPNPNSEVLLEQPGHLLDALFSDRSTQDLASRAAPVALGGSEASLSA
jgi:transketolase